MKGSMLSSWSFWKMVMVLVLSTVLTAIVVTELSGRKSVSACNLVM